MRGWRYASIVGVLAASGCTALSGADELSVAEPRGGGSADSAEREAERSELFSQPSPTPGEVGACGAACGDESACCAAADGAGACRARDERCEPAQVALECDGPDDCGPGEACCISALPFHASDRAACQWRYLCAAARIVFCNRDEDCDEGAACTGRMYGASVCR